LISGGSYSAFHEGSGVTTGALRFVGIEVYAGKGLSGTGAMAGSVCAYIQSSNQNVTGAITDCYDIYIATPITTGTITNNYAIYQVSPAAFSFFAGLLAVGTASVATNVALRVQRSFTVAANIYGVWSSVTQTAAAASALFHYGMTGIMTTAGAQNYTIATEEAVTGVYGQAIHSGTGTNTGVTGVRGYALKSGTGVVAVAKGVSALCANTAANALTVAYSFFGTTPVNSGGGTIGTFYGCYLSAGAGTTIYGLAQVGTADLNYFAGKSAFGSAAPVATAFALFGASTAAITSQRILQGSAAYAGTVEGDFWNDFTQHCLIGYLAGVKQFDTRTLFVQTADQTISNSNVETTLFGAGIGTLTMPINFFVVGKSIRVTLRGILTNDATPPTTTFRLKLGGVTFASVADTPVINLTNVYWEISWIVICRTTGAGGTAIGQGCLLEQVTAVAGTPILFPITMSATAALNTTAVAVLDVTAHPNVADAGSSITCTNATVEVCA
jgi:hypothetical protein